MRAIILLITLILLSACGKPGVRTEIVEICSGDVPIILPDEIVCNHAPADVIQVDTVEIIYLCTKFDGNHDNRSEK